MDIKTTKAINNAFKHKQKSTLRNEPTRKTQRKEIKRHLISTDIKHKISKPNINVTVKLDDSCDSFERDSTKVTELEADMYSSGKSQRIQRNKSKQIQEGIKTATISLRDKMEGFDNSVKRDKKERKLRDHFYSSRKDYKNLSSILRQIKETPKHMVDYKHSLEQTMFKKKLGLERIDKFQSTLLQASVDQKGTTLPKLREKSFGDTPSSENRISYQSDKGVKEKLGRSQKASTLNADILQNMQKKNRTKFSDLKQDGIKDKNSQSFRHAKSTTTRTLNKKMRKRYKLKPLDTSVQVSEVGIQKSPLQAHLKQLSSIIGEDYNTDFKTPCEPSSSITARPRMNFEKLNDLFKKKSAEDSRARRSSIKSVKPENIVTPSGRNPVNITKSSSNISQLEISEEKEELDEDKIDDINFMNILMYINGEEKGINVANDAQFQEICNLMDEYYGLSERKILNKYEIWKKYIRNLQMKKNFEERSSQGAALSFKAEGKESKNEMMNRYSAYLSKKWFSNADPFLKAKYKKFFEESEVKWGPNMVFKRLAKETDKLNKIKGLVEKRLDKETLYVNNRIKVNSINQERKNISSEKTSDGEDFEIYINKPHSDTCKYCRLNQSHTHHKKTNSDLPLPKPSKTQSQNPSIPTPSSPTSSQAPPSTPPHQNEGLKMLHHKLSLRFST
ncbi:unnamed protein product [Moneuplotes crassus]|uniref:Uncharacterized protein n=2 Tax=Euplotes crassus TaxID=5936 RepID=A0AAD1YA84_EUPCR|nr:unnamed protein product [Moneuplotes crassus]